MPALPQTSEHEGVSPSRRRRSWQWFLIGVIAVGLAGLAAATLVRRLGDRMPPLTEAAFSAALDRWEQHGPASYDLDLTLGGARPGTVHVEVRDQVVTAFERDGYTPEQRRLWATWSVPGQFETIELELEGALDPQQEMGFEAGTEFLLRAEFDPALGYPRGFQRVVLGGGPEVYWRVTRFAAK